MISTILFIWIVLGVATFIIVSEYFWHDSKSTLYEIGAENEVHILFLAILSIILFPSLIYIAYVEHKPNVNY